ncbi:VCBS domain-containing protein [Azospirillum sp. sgz302134]
MRNNGDGTWTFTPAADYNGSVSLAYSVVDGQGGTVNATQSVTLAPVNDPATISGGATGTVTEDGTLTTGGTLAVADVDSGEAKFRTPASLAGTYGTFAFNADTGVWGYTLTNSQANVQALKAGEQVTDKLTVTSLDGTASRDIVVTVTGANDAPVLTGTKATLTGGTEDTAYTIRAADLLQGYTDADSDTLSVSGLTVTNGTLTDNGDGTWTFTPARDFFGTVSLSYRVTDGQGGSVPATQSFAVAAVNDAPVPGSIANVTRSEDDAAFSQNLLAGATDVEGDALSVRNLTVTAVDQGNAAVTLPTGAYTLSGSTLTIDPAVFDSLPAGQSVTMTVAYEVSDGVAATPARYTVTIQGANDAAVIGSPANNAVVEDVSVDADGKLTATGTLAISDPDRNEASFRTTVVAANGNLGSLTLKADGSYRYAVDNAAVQHLGVGQTKTERFTVTALDGTAKEIAFTITGANDAPAFTSAPAAQTYTDTSTTDRFAAFTGTLTAGDRDGEAVSFGIQGGTGQGNVVTKAGAYGTLTVNTATGAFTFTRR